MNEQPHVENASGKVPEPVLQNNPGPHVETTGSVPDATGNDSPVTVHDNPVPGTVPAPVPLEPAKPFDAVEFFKSMSMPAEAQEALAKWQADSEELSKVRANLVTSKILDTMSSLL